MVDCTNRDYITLSATDTTDKKTGTDHIHSGLIILSSTIHQEVICS